MQCTGRIRGLIEKLASREKIIRPEKLDRQRNMWQKLKQIGNKYCQQR